MKRFALRAERQKSAYERRAVVKTRFRKRTSGLEKQPNAHSASFPESIRRHGKLFLQSVPRKRVGKHGKLAMDIVPAKYDASLALQIKGRVAVKLKLGFSGKNIIILGIQGPTHEGVLNIPELRLAEEIKAINTELGMPWPKFLLQEVERYAREQGYKSVRILDPEQNYYYTHPVIPFVRQQSLPKTSKRARMLRTRLENQKQPQLSKDELAALKSPTGRGYRNFFGEKVIENGKLVLNPKIRDSGKEGRQTYEEIWEHLEYYIKIAPVQADLRRKIKQFYHLVAKNNGYKKSGQFFVKHL